MAARLRPGEAVCLFGPLGAGKSTLARGLVRALTTPDEEAPSPTFTLVQAYEGRDFPLAHFDLYRLARADEAYELGLDEALEVGAAVIEWPERLGAALPPDRLEVRLEIAPAARPSGPPSDAGSDAGPTPNLGAAAGEAQPRLARLAGFGSWTGRERDLL